MWCYKIFKINCVPCSNFIGIKRCTKIKGILLIKQILFCRNLSLSLLSRLNLIVNFIIISSAFLCFGISASYKLHHLNTYFFFHVEYTPLFSSIFYSMTCVGHVGPVLFVSVSKFQVLQYYINGTIKPS